MSQHHSPGGVFHYVAAWGGVGARAGACQSVAIFHQSVGGMAGPADRPASGAHFVPGPGRHSSPAPLTVRTALERVGRPHSLPGSGPGWHQTAQQPVAVSQVVPHSLGEIPLAPGRTVPDPAGATGQDGLGHLGRECAGEAGKHRRLFHTEGLCPVRSSKAARLKRIKPGYYNPPGGPPVFVPGLQWLTVMVAGMQGPPCLAAMRWWTSRGHLASGRQEQTASLLSQCAESWQKRVVHVFDRGYAGAPWLRELGVHQARFIKPGSSGPVHHALAHPLSLGRREGRASRLADHPGQTLPRLSPDLGHSPPSISQDRHRGGLGMNREPSPSRRGTVAGGLSSRQGPYSLVPADQ